MSDVFGELVDLSDGVGTDTAATRWQLGEDLPPRAGGVARDMADPPAFGQPDHTGSDLYDFAPDYDDNGGVHTNSGVPNKTAYLVADGTVAEPGGAFNGLAFPGIGADKAAAVYWATLLMLTPGADFADLAAVLQQACANLAGAATAGLTPVDCQTVAAAASATGLDRWAGPSEPRNVTMTGGPRSVRVTWEPPESTGASPLTSYAMHLRPAVRGEDFFPVKPAARELVLDGLRSGTAYTVGLVAVTADGTSPSVVRQLGGTDLRVGWPPSSRYGSTLRVRGTLTASGGVAAAGRTVRLLRRYPHSPSYERVASAVTATDGGFTLSSRPRRGATYFVIYPGSAGEIGARGAQHVLPVRQRVGLRVDDSLRLGQVAVFRGAVALARAGAPVRLERRVGRGDWRTVVRGRLGRGGHYDLSTRPTTRRDATWRVVVPAPRTGGLAAGRSREVPIRVR